VYGLSPSLGEAVPIASNLASPSGLALDGTILVFVEKTDGRVDAIDKSTIEGTPTVITSAAQQPFRVVASGGIAYWTDQVSRTVSSAQESSGPPVTPITSDLTMPMGIALDPPSALLVWLDRSTGGTSTGALWACALANGACASAPVPFASTQDQPTSVALDDTAVYWTTRTSVMKLTR